VHSADPPPTRTPPRRTAVVIPVRGLEGAKSRLGAVLDAEERRELVELLLRRTIAAALAAPGVDRVVVVSPEAAALAVAREAGADAIAQHTSGLNPGLVEARDALAGTADRMLVLPADIPGVGPHEVARLLAAADSVPAGRPVVVLAPDRHGRGTNALLLDPARIIEPAFGGDSRDAHAGLAAASGAAFVEVEGVLDLDLDTPDDLLLVEAIRPEALHVH
jgi:2-phospho-L-lactate/phosphoenolpyruvate guanylyltransferase